MATDRLKPSLKMKSLTGIKLSSLKVEPIYANEDELDERVIRKLADAMWISLDQQLKFEVSQKKFRLL